VGVVFVVAVHRATDEVAEAPLAATVIRSDIRRKVLRSFPCSLFYAAEADAIMIVSVAHQRRRPSYWHARLRTQKDRS
jgi:plasmid stabilization system protein ParE